MNDDSETGWLRLHGDMLEGNQRFEYGQGRAFCLAVMRYWTWLEGEARKLVGGDKERARRAARRALGRLWEWDVDRFNSQDDAYLRRALLTAMRMETTGAYPQRQRPTASSTLRPNRKDSGKYFASVRGMELE
jgi:hypothetical protein